MSNPSQLSNPSQWNNKTVWITGASSGIGEALAIGFAALGANLVSPAAKRLCKKWRKPVLVQRL